MIYVYQTLEQVGNAPEQAMAAGTIYVFDCREIYPAATHPYQVHRVGEKCLGEYHTLQAAMDAANREDQRQRTRQGQP